MTERSLHYRTCPLCEATCGLELTVDDGVVGRIRGDRDDVFSKGFICPKGSTLKHLHEDPDRLRAPMVKRGESHVEVSWDEAFAEIERLLMPVLEAHGRESAAIYLGNPSVHNYALTVYGRALITALGTKNIYSASTVDQMPRHASCGFLYGDGLAIPVPDLDRTDYLLVLGANPYESNGSLATAPDWPGRLEAIRERGGRLVVVDPRRTKTTDNADEHLRIRPGGDAAWLAAIAQVLFAEDLVDLGPAGEHLDGVEAVAELVAPFTPEAVERATWIEPEVTRRIARELAAAPTAAVYGRIGTNTVEFGTLASWLTDVVTALTGNLDRPGGLMWPHGAHQKVRRTGPGRGFTTGRWHTRVSGHPEVRSEFPVAALAEEITTPGEGQIRALVTVAGNPARSIPDSARTEAALASLDVMVSVDPYLNETTRHADVILPPPSPLARSHYDLAFYALAIRNVANYSPPLFEPTGPLEEDIVARLALVVSGQGADADPQLIHDMVLGTVLAGAVAGDEGPLAGRDPAELEAQLGARSPADRVLEVMLRIGWAGDRFGADPDGLTMEKLEANPHGIDLGALTPQLPGVLKTTSGRVELVAEPVAADVDRLRTWVDTVDDRPVLVGRRHLRSNNSWMHNVEVLVKGKERCTLQVHPDDAKSWGLSDGGDAKVTSSVGSVVVPVEVTDDVSPSVVSLPHGWGHDAPGTRMEVAARRPGVNSNLLTDGSIVDPLSGNAVLNGIPVEVVPA
ncbi:MAG: molybdopterin-dependent oxidoreductase [Actinobacteria bacterium]|nr:molybdopterin-dependent oxidoreductase [Actinomycetota bacterium]